MKKQCTKKMNKITNKNKTKSYVFCVNFYMRNMIKFENFLCTLKVRKASFPL